MEHTFPSESFQRENRTTFSEVPFISEIFQWNEPQTCVPFTSQPEFPEFLGKWKMPTVSNVSCNLFRFDDHMRLKEHFHWLVPQMLHELQDRCFTAQMLKKFVATFAESRTSIILSATVSETCLSTFLAVARYVTLGNDSCNLFRNGVARQVARNIAQCKSA